MQVAPHMWLAWSPKALDTIIYRIYIVSLHLACMLLLKVTNLSSFSSWQPGAFSSNTVSTTAQTLATFAVLLCWLKLIASHIQSLELGDFLDEYILVRTLIYFCVTLYLFSYIIFFSCNMMSILCNFSFAKLHYFTLFCIKINNLD